MRDLPAAFLKHLDNNKSWIGPRPVSADDADKLEVTSANWHQTHGKGERGGLQMEYINVSVRLKDQ